MTSTSNAGPLDASFTAAICKDGAFATYLELAGSDEQLLGTRRAVKVAGTLGGIPSRPPSCPRADQSTRSSARSSTWYDWRIRASETPMPTR